MRSARLPTVSEPTTLSRPSARAPSIVASSTSRLVVTKLSLSGPSLYEGPVVLQKTVGIGPDDTLGSVYFDWLFPLGVDAMLEAADLVVSGKHTETVQDESQASYEGWCKDAEARVNWHSNIDTVHNLIRGCDPAPGAWTQVNGTKVRLFEARKHPVRRFADVVGKPGEVSAVSDRSISISVQGGTIEIFKVRTEKGEKLSGAAFAEAYGLKPGMKIEMPAVVKAAEPVA